MESWRLSWRKGIEPLLSRAALMALANALRDDDCRLQQGATTRPPPLMCVEDWPVEAACPIAFCGLAEGLETVGECEKFFANLCYEADLRLDEPAGCRWFINWADETPRDEMRRELLAEIEHNLAARAA